MLPTLRTLKDILRKHAAFWEQEFLSFCEKTSIHGWSRVPNTDRFRKIFWLFTIISSIGLGVFFSYSVYHQFMVATVQTLIVSTTEPLDYIVFPKIVVCNKYKLRSSFLRHLLVNKTSTEYHQISAAIYRKYISGYYKENESFEASDQRVLGGLPQALTSLDSRDLTAFIQTMARQQTSVLQPVENGRVTVDALTGCQMVVWNGSSVMSGLSNGLEIMLDAEVYDNADPEANSDGFHILVTDPEDASLVDLNGFQVTTGSAVYIKLQPNLYTISNSAKYRFNYKERKCVYAGEYLLPENVQKMINSSEYSHAGCLLAATMAEAGRRCPGADTRSLHNSGRVLGCVNDVLENMGMYETVQPANAETEIECCVKCERQTNQLLRSEHIFPNRMFARQKKFWWIVHQLFLTCTSDQDSGYGSKRRLLMKPHPHICAFFDTYILKNTTLVTIFETSPEAILDQVNNQTFAEFTKNDLDLDDDSFDTILGDILHYCKENIVRLTVYLERPYVTKYETDQEMSIATFLANLGGMLGFCMGLSLVGVVEIIYHLIISPLIQIAQYLSKQL